MATTVTLDSTIIGEVMELTGESTKASAIRKALSEFVRLRRLKELADMAGTLDLMYTNEEIEAIEEDEPC